MKIRYRKVTFQDGNQGVIKDLPGKVEIHVAGPTPQTESTEISEAEYKQNKEVNSGKQLHG